ncbi:heparinase II/III family protein [Paenibacillus sp. IB182496]|uniref:Heparinase II/III family protein n=1 Tax=Paenibacillus sabuli TaxID=2772509 RepID=A0A927BRA0_9BACL|nr:heparinase II/III family protein [Paenibacillus sabuli]MBD2844028.1 heparinase II/III family protein [Paenibacillus sabuli]
MSQFTERRPLVRDWAAVRATAQDAPWARAMIAHLKPETDWWVAHYEDDPSRVAGWGHRYYCRTCSAQLIFDKTSPHAHVCGSCGAANRHRELDEAWNASYRSVACNQVFHAAVWYRLYGDPAYLSYMRRVLGFLSRHFADFRVDTPPGFVGKFTGINLTDAFAVNWMLLGLELVRDEFAEDELCGYMDRLFRPMAEYLTTARGGTPNISCWMRAAAGMIGLVFEEREWCVRAADGFEGLREMLAKGLMPGGLWYESSFVYHYLTAEAITYYAVLCDAYRYPFPELTGAARRMYVQPMRFLFPDGRMPSPNDGWPLRSLATYTRQYEWMRAGRPDPELDAIVARCYDEIDAMAPKERQRALRGAGLARLLFGRDARQSSARCGAAGDLSATESRDPAARRAPAHSHALAELDGVTHGWRPTDEASAAAAQHEVAPAWLGHPRTAHYDPDLYYVLLENRTATVFFKYGFVIDGHAHADVMHFELFAHGQLLSRDISNSGYASDLFRDWQRLSIAHNTVMIDKRSQPRPRPAGQMLHFAAEANHCIARAENVYPGWSYIRELQLEEDVLRDRFTVERCASADPERAASSGAPAADIGVTDPAAAATAQPSASDRPEETHSFDWLFHCSGEPSHVLPLKPVDPPGDADGYPLMQDVSTCCIDDDWSVSWAHEGVRLTLRMAGAPGTTVYLFRGYEHRSDLLRWGVLVRRFGQAATYEADYTFGSVPPR